MQARQIELGEEYVAKVSGRLCVVRVRGIVEHVPMFGTDRTVWHCTNLNTGRAIVIRSAQRFRRRSVHSDLMVYSK